MLPFPKGGWLVQIEGYREDGAAEIEAEAVRRAHEWELRRWLELED